MGQRKVRLQIKEPSRELTGRWFHQGTKKIARIKLLKLIKDGRFSCNQYSSSRRIREPEAWGAVEPESVGACWYGSQEQWPLHGVRYQARGCQGQRPSPASVRLAAEKSPLLVVVVLPQLKRCSSNCIRSQARNLGVPAWRLMHIINYSKLIVADGMSHHLLEPEHQSMRGCSGVVGS